MTMTKDTQEKATPSASPAKTTPSASPDKSRYCGECGREVTDHRPGCLSQALKGNLTDARRAIFDKAMAEQEVPAKLRFLADAFEKEALYEHAMHLRMRATTKEGERAGGRKRELGTIKAARKGILADRGVQAVEVSIEFGEGVTAQFQTVFLRDADMEKFVEAVLSLFAKKEMHELEGIKVHALRAWDDPQEPVEGLESLESGQRITKTGWLRAYDPTGQHPSPLDRRATHIAHEIARLRIEIEARSEEMKKLEDGYTDWEKVP